MPWDADNALRLDVQFVARLNNLTPAMSEARDLLVAQVEENFASESAAGEGWEYLKDSTLRDRARKGFPPAPILERTGNLKAAATGHREVGIDYAEVGLQEGHPYGHFHIASGSRDLIPLRDFLAVSEETIYKIDDAIIEHLERDG